MIPSIILTWLGREILSQEQSMQEVRFEKLIIEQLNNIDINIQRYILEHQLKLGITLSQLEKTDDWRKVPDQYPLIRQAFVIGTDGKRVYPPIDQEITKSEQLFLNRSQIIWTDQTLFQHASIDLEGYEQSTAFSTLQQKIYKPNKQGWYTWFWGNGLNIVYWVQTTSGSILGADLNTTRIKADLITMLPDTSTSRNSNDNFRLLDSAGDIIYQWGNYEPILEVEPIQQISLSPPLSGWRLEYYTPETKPLAVYKKFHIFSVVTIFILSLGLLAFYLYREFQRDALIASQRVNFVNQVSHELKTPLTNIRMYTELLEDVIEEKEAQPRHYLNVIMTESQRLSRLISNVLSFGQSEKQHLKLELCPGDVDYVIEKCIDAFRPALKQKGVEIVFNKTDKPAVIFDPDVVEQILNNLIGNVEKYAASGGYMEIAHKYKSGKTIIQVIDHGPGIPVEEQNRIFDPFYRISSKLSDGVSGTGIGLNIARQLARLHGGGIVFINKDKGSCFEVSLATTIAGEES